MNELDECHELTSDRARRDKVVLCMLGSAGSGMFFLAAFAGPGASDGSGALCLVLGAIFLVGSITLALSASNAQKIWASAEGIEIESKDDSISVPWRDVSQLVISEWQTKPWRLAALNLRIDGKTQRIRFVPCVQCDEWFEYFRSGGDGEDG